MKHLSIFLAILLLGFSTSCKKDKNDPDDSGSGGGGAPAPKSFTANVNGNTFTAISVNATIENGEMYLEGSNGSVLIKMTVFQEGSGSYFSPSTECNMIYELSDGSSEEIEGTFSITDINTATKRITGSFQGSTSSGIDITQGIFTSIPYTGVFSGAGVPPTQEGSLDLDGTAFSPDLITGNQGFGRIALNIARSSDDESVGFNLIETIEAGEFNLSNLGDYRASYGTSGDVNDQYVAGSGSLKIIAHNTEEKYIVGEFNFTAVPSTGSSSTNTYNISNGSFAINY